MNWINPVVWIVGGQGQRNCGGVWRQSAHAPKSRPWELANHGLQHAGFLNTQRKRTRVRTWPAICVTIKTSGNGRYNCRYGIFLVRDTSLVIQRTGTGRQLAGSKEASERSNSKEATGTNLDLFSRVNKQLALVFILFKCSYSCKSKLLKEKLKKKVLTTLLFSSQLQNLILLISFQIKIVCVFIFWLDGLWLVVICTVLIGCCRRMLRLRRRRNSTSCLTKNSLNQLEEERTPSPSGQSNSKSAARWR